MKAIEIKRGDIVFVENPNKKPRGHVVCGNHPAVVIQNNKGNEHSTNIIVAFITSSMKRLEMPTHIVIPHYDGLRIRECFPDQLLYYIVIMHQLRESAPRSRVQNHLLILRIQYLEHYLSD